MPDSNSNSSPVEIRSYFVRGRNALVARGEFSPIYIDYYLHRADHALIYSNEHDAMLKDAVAALTLHLASRPQEETTGWTLNFHEPRLNLFVTGASRPCRVAGRVFTEDVREFGRNMFIAQTSRPHHAPMQSMIDFTTTDVFTAIEQYHAQSEQRLTRLFRHDEEDIVMISAQPDCDEAWLAALTIDDIRKLDQTETLVLMEKRHYIWECGCSVNRLYPILAKLAEQDLDDVFGNEEIVTLTCPRCGARYRAAREQFEAWKEDDAEESKNGKLE